MGYRRDVTEIAWIDVETTGVDVNNDRIVQISVIKTDLNLTPVSDAITAYVNPNVPIPPESTEVHGITDDMVASAPTFDRIAVGLTQFIKNCHFGGYNVRFDLQVLMAELSRLNYSLSLKGLMIIDPLVTLRVKEPRDQSSVYKYYTGRDLTSAHDAEADILATLEIAQAQREKYEDVKTVEDMWRLSEPETMCDLAGKFKMKDGVPVFTFGQHIGKPIVEHISFLQWMLSKDFPQNTKDWINEFLKNQ